MSTFSILMVKFVLPDTSAGKSLVPKSGIITNDHSFQNMGRIENKACVTTNIQCDPEIRHREIATAAKKHIRRHNDARSPVTIHFLYRILTFIIFFCMIAASVAAEAIVDEPKCGERGIAFFKLHKVGSTTISNVVTSYGKRHNLRICKGSSKLRDVQDCDISASHAGSLILVEQRRYNLTTFLEETANRLGPPLTVAVFRDPRERWISRYFFGLTLDGDFHAWNWETVKQSVLDAQQVSTLASKSGGNTITKYYVSRLRADSAEAAVEALSRFDVVCISEAIDACVAEIALKLGCQVQDWRYHSEKRVLGHPTFQEFPPQLQQMINQSVADDLLVWQEALRMHEEEQETLPGLPEATAWLQHHAHGCTFEVSDTEDFRVKAQKQGRRPAKDCFGDASGEDFAKSFVDPKHNEGSKGGKAKTQRHYIDFPPYEGHGHD